MGLAIEPLVDCKPAPGGTHPHVARLQLLGRDAPTYRASNGTFTVTANSLQLRLPVHEGPGGQVQRPLAPLDRDGGFAWWFQLARR